MVLWKVILRYGEQKSTVGFYVLPAHAQKGRMAIRFQLCIVLQHKHAVNFYQKRTGKSEVDNT
jgi:hypothetical protein